MAALCLCLPTSPSSSAEPQGRTTPPNVVVILADDLGYGDVRCNNPQRGKIPTPHIDRLAAEGMRFTDAHSSSGVCSPSRYTLLTGRYHWRTRLQQGIVGVWGPPLIAADRLTIGGLARQQGYATACVGKWHLGWDWPIDADQQPHFRAARSKGASDEGDPEPTPEDRAAWQAVFTRPIGGGPITRGFDSYFGTDVPNWPPYCFLHDDRTVGVPSRWLPRAKLTGHLASLPGPALADWRLEDILPALARHAVEFITRQAAAGKPFLLYLPLTTPHTPLAVNEAWRGKSGLGNAAADLIMETDDVVGQVLAALARSGAARNTLVLFTSDNGFAPYVGAKELEAQGHYPSGPLRGYKGDAWEGGHRVPFVVRWPATVKPGSTCGQLVHHADLLATLADIFGRPLPATAGEDSVSLLPLLGGADRAVRQHAVSCGSSGVPALRHGSWKLILAPSGGGAWSKLSADPAAKDEDLVQLYDLAADLGETHNLAAARPELVAAMRQALETIVAQGRSTPGAPQPNDVEVRRYPAPPAKPAAKPQGRAKSRPR